MKSVEKSGFRPEGYVLELWIFFRPVGERCPGGAGWGAAAGGDGVRWGGRVHPIVGPSFSSRSSLMLWNSSSADWRFLTILLGQDIGLG